MNDNTLKISTSWKKYRIVRDRFSGFSVEYKLAFVPFWLQCDFSNTHSTIEEAMAFALSHSKHVVREL